MENESSINLLSPRAKLSDKFSGIADSLSRMSLVGLGTLLGVGLLVGGSYLFLQQRYNTLLGRRNNLRSQVSSEPDKEAVLMTLHQWAEVTDKLFASQMSWAPLVERVDQIAPPPALGSISVDEKHHVTVTMKTSSLEDNFPILAAVVSDVEAKKILSPEIVSFQLDKDGITNLVVSFFPVL